MQNKTKIALVGCGYVASFYMSTMKNHPQLEVAGVTDINMKRALLIRNFYKVPLFKSIEEILKDKSIKIVVNLTCL